MNYTITPGSATYSTKASGGGEFGGKLTGTVTFRANATLHNITVSIWPDVTLDADHDFTVALSAPNGATLIRTTGTGTILDPATG